MMKPKHTPFDLECGHRRWFQPAHRPRKSELVWCPQCRDMVKGTNAAASEGTVIWKDGYSTTPIGHGFTVECLTCNDTWTAGSYASAETSAFSHIAVNHGRSSLITGDRLTIKKPRLDF